MLIDTGIGMSDIADPHGRIGTDAIEAAGFRFIPAVTAVAQLRSQGLEADAVTDIVLTHCDPDHVGGLSDFPSATVHLSAEEKANLDSGNPRYSLRQFSHDPRWRLYPKDDSEFFGLPARVVQTALDVEIRLVPLFGHTLGHCGVAVGDNGQWTFHIGDAYYLREELSNTQHPVDGLAAQRADDDATRRYSLALLRSFREQTRSDVMMCGYHDTGELPETVPSFDSVR